MKCAQAAASAPHKCRISEKLLIRVAAPVGATRRGRGSSHMGRRAGGELAVLRYGCGYLRHSYRPPPPPHSSDGTVSTGPPPPPRPLRQGGMLAPPPRRRRWPGAAARSVAMNSSPRHSLVRAVGNQPHQPPRHRRHRRRHARRSRVSPPPRHASPRGATCTSPRYPSFSYGGGDARPPPPPTLHRHHQQQPRLGVSL